MTQGEEVQFLRERVRQLEGMILDRDFSLKSAFGLTMQEARILRCLVVRGSAVPSSIIEEVWPDGYEPSNPERQIRVVLYHIRRKLKPAGIEIHSRSRYGYWIDDATRKQIRERVWL